MISLSSIITIAVIITVLIWFLAARKNRNKAGTGLRAYANEFVANVAKATSDPHAVLRMRIDQRRDKVGEINKRRAELSARKSGLARDRDESVKDATTARSLAANAIATMPEKAKRQIELALREEKKAQDYDTQISTITEQLKALADAATRMTREADEAEHKLEMLSAASDIAEVNLDLSDDGDLQEAVKDMDTQIDNLNAKAEIASERSQLLETDEMDLSVENELAKLRQKAATPEPAAA